MLPQLTTVLYNTWCYSWQQTTHMMVHFHGSLSAGPIHSQCLAYVPPMGSLCLARGHSSGCLRSSGAGGLPGPSPAPPSAPCTLCLLERQLGALLRGPRGASVSPGEVVRNLHLFSKSFVRGRQEDSHEVGAGGACWRGPGEGGRSMLG